MAARAYHAEQSPSHKTLRDASEADVEAGSGSQGA